VEHDLIEQALQQAGGNVTLAAEALGITRDTLRYRMDKHKLRRSSFTC
jgi:two-component system response regulator AtoC